MTRNVKSQHFRARSRESSKLVMATLSRGASVTLLVLCVTLLGGCGDAHAEPSPPGDDQNPATFHTDVIFLDVVQASRGVALYKRVIGIAPGAHVSVGKDPKSMVAHDTRARLARFRVLVSMLDRGEGARDRIFVRPVAHMLPSDLARMVLDVMNPKARQTMMLVPDDRSGKLVVRTSSAVYKRLDLLIRRVDVPSRTKRTVRVVPAPGAP